MIYLALDIGNILVNLEMEPFKKALSKQVNISRKNADDFIDQIQKQQDLGSTTMKDELIKQFNIKSEYIIEDLLDSWNSVVKPNEMVMNFLNDLISEYDIKVALVSNIGFDHLNYFNRILKDNDLYKNSIHHFSCEIGARKPTTLYYKLFLELNPEFKNCVYVDDLAENRIAGNNLGFASFNFDLSKCSNTQDIFHDLYQLKAFMLENQ